jgi:hypothetical protein
MTAGDSERCLDDPRSHGSATPASSDGASATDRTRRSKGFWLLCCLPDAPLDLDTFRKSGANGALRSGDAEQEELT